MIKSTVDKTFQPGSIEPITEAGVTFCGARIAKCEQGYSYCQEHYAEKVGPIDARQVRDALQAGEKNPIRAVIGSLLWLAKSRPDISYGLSQIAQHINN